MDWNQKTYPVRLTLGEILGTLSTLSSDRLVEFVIELITPLPDRHLDEIRKWIDNRTTRRRGET